MPVETNTTPNSADPGVVTRNIPSGTQAISGTVTANQGTPGDAANAWPVQVVDAGAVVLDLTAEGNPRAAAVWGAIVERTATGAELLGANATYSTGWIDAQAKGWVHVRGTVYSDKAGSLYVEQSPNGTDVTELSELSAVAAATGTKFERAIYARYVRIRYLNGVLAQATDFRLYAYGVSTPL